MNFLNFPVLVLSLSAIIGISFAADVYGIECPETSGNFSYINASAYLEHTPFEGGQISTLYCQYEASPDLEETPFGEIYAIYNFTGEASPLLAEDYRCGATLGEQYYPMYVSSTSHFASVAFSTIGLVEVASKIMTQIEDQNIGAICTEDQTQETSEESDVEKTPSLEISNAEFKEKSVDEIIKEIKEYVGQQEEDQLAEFVLPEWIKNNANWWSTDQITADEFALGIEFMIKEGIIKVPQTEVLQESANEIPDWVKKNAGWWSEDLISDQEFVNGLQFLISNGIISVG